ncbi:Mitochondrial inner membrane protein oxa1l [Rhizophlyctis rosea]|nr:Mitochondrial inner membrane protein oxa1l [Rhizophlyctis rosea]
MAAAVRSLSATLSRRGGRNGPFLGAPSRITQQNSVFLRSPRTPTLAIPASITSLQQSRNISFLWWGSSSDTPSKLEGRAQEAWPPRSPSDAPAAAQNTPPPSTPSPTFPSTGNPVTDAATSATEPSTATASAWTDASIEELPAKLEAVTKLGDLKALGLEGWSPVGLAERLLELVYVTTGLPWWATIVVTTFIIRGITLPFFLKSQRAAAIIHNLKPQADVINAAIKLARRTQDKMGQRTQTQKLMQLYKDNGTTMLAPMWAMVQAPFFLSFFLALRKMADVHVPGFDKEGLWWFSDLTVYDPYYVLPLLATAGLMITVELGAETGQQVRSPLMKKVFRTIALGGLWWTCELPAAVFTYWVASNGITLVQTMLIKRPAVRKFLNIQVKNPNISVATPPSATSRIGLGAAYRMIKEARRESGRRAEKAGERGVGGGVGVVGKAATAMRR